MLTMVQRSLTDVGRFWLDFGVSLGFVVSNLKAGQSQSWLAAQLHIWVSGWRFTTASDPSLSGIPVNVCIAFRLQVRISLSRKHCAQPSRL